MKPMTRPLVACLFSAALLALPVSSLPALAQNNALSADDSAAAASDYEQYCALCHGPDREGHINDHAPSLRSRSLMESGQPYIIRNAIGYGRLGTPMAGYLDEVGGPMSRNEIRQLARWLQQESGVENSVSITMEPVTGDIDLGAALYVRECVECHGAEGEGVTGTALGNPAMLSLTPDQFLRHAIIHGRQDTEMPAFGERLSGQEVDAVTAFLRSRDTGWTVQKPVYRSPPPKEEWVMNPDGQDPEFDLMDKLYVTSAQLDQAIRDGRKMILLDTRVISFWQMVNIQGSVPIPYYTEDFDGLARDLLTDGTWIVTYCECPRAAAESVNRKLKARGFENSAVLWEGIQGWIALGYPVSRGRTESVEVRSLAD
jgi:mono/diheme cytochrome c family protein/rhodanese-related sulfurtransferase